MYLVYSVHLIQRHKDIFGKCTKRAAKQIRKKMDRTQKSGYRTDEEKYYKHNKYVPVFKVDKVSDLNNENKVSNINNYNSLYIPNLLDYMMLDLFVCVFHTLSNK